MTKWIKENKSWLFSGIGLSIVYGLYKFISNISIVINWIFNNSQVAFTILIILLVIIIAIMLWIIKNKDNKLKDSPIESKTSKQKSEWNIVIVDDKQFKLESILRTAGWLSTQKVIDIEAWDSPEILNTDIFFIDINGVGKKLDFKDEGLGLAYAIKRKFPEKYVIIYSANPEGYRLHDALNKADAILEKDADPYEFLEVLNEITGH